MPATYTLSTTSFLIPVSQGATQVKVASTSGLTPGVRLFADKEMMQVVSLGVSTLVNVKRGVDGTAAAPHGSDVTVYIGTGDQFFAYDPVGQPPPIVLVSPHINVRTGDVWFAQGDDLTSGQRYWQKQSVARAVGPLGVLTATPDVTAST